MKKQIINYSISAIIVVIIIAGGIIAIKKAKQRDADAPVAQRFPITVSTTTLQYNQNTLTLPYIAQVQNDQDVIISTKIPARILQILPTGTSVNTGEVIARLDNTAITSNIESINAQIKALQTSLDNLNAMHKRTIELMAVKGASKEQSENEISKITETESKIASLQQNKNDLNNTLTYTTITAPVSGVISKTTANVGDIAMSGQPLAFISTTKGAYLKVSLPAQLVVKGVIKNNLFYSVKPLNSTINSLAEYRINIDHLNLLSGERVPIDVVVFNGKSILLPFDAVLNRNGKSYVFVANNDKATPIEVQILQTGENGIIINNPELIGKNVIVEKQDVLLSLLSGTPIQIKK